MQLQLLTSSLKHYNIIHKLTFYCNFVHPLVIPSNLPLNDDVANMWAIFLLIWMSNLCYVDKKQIKILSFKENNNSKEKPRTQNLLDPFRSYFNLRFHRHRHQQEPDRARPHDCIIEGKPQYHPTRGSSTSGF